ncbi:hypothetical protein B7992_16135 [Fibrobacter sp. UWH1]|nr:hypothetical protein B7992_16135 [Fibrobacter sp. UWH1]
MEVAKPFGLARRLICAVSWSARLNGHGRDASAKLGDLAVITRQPDPGGGSVAHVPGAGGTPKNGDAWECACATPESHKF